MMGGCKENSVKLEVEIDCAVDTTVLSKIEWFMLSGETPRKAVNHRRNSRTKTWKIVDLCTWIGKKVNYKVIKCI